MSGYLNLGPKLAAERVRMHPDQREVMTLVSSHDLESNHGEVRASVFRVLKSEPDTDVDFAVGELLRKTPRRREHMLRRDHVALFVDNEPSPERPSQHDRLIAEVARFARDADS